MDLALNNLQRLICHKTNQPTNHLSPHSLFLAQSAGVVEYTNCFSAEGKPPVNNECPDYNIKQSDGGFPVMLELWGMWSTPSLQSL